MARRNFHVGGEQLPLIVPDSDWVRPSELPDLRRLPMIGVDTEDRDDGLSAGRGPGWARRAGHVCGVSVAWREGKDVRSGYYPLRHPDSDCFDPDAVRRWLDDHEAAGVTFVMQNAPYDVGWLHADLGARVPSRLHDTTCLATMLDENRLSYDLNSLCRWRGVAGKDERLLREAAAAYGWHGDDVKKNLWKMPAKLVGPYAEPDAVGALLLAESMLPDIEQQGLTEAYQLEMDLIPMVHEMRRRGIRIDVDRAMRNQAALRAERDEKLESLRRQLSARVMDMEVVRSPQKLAVHFDSEHVSYSRTKKTGQPSFESEWMAKHKHWLPKTVAEVRALDDAAEKFLGEYVLGFSSGGRLHASVNQFRTDDGGTRSYRFSYSDPPLQQLHGDKHPKLRDALRQCFLPEEGQVWCSADYKQQEMKLIVHFAALVQREEAARGRTLCVKADLALAKYVDDPNTDYHTMVAGLTGLDRRNAKDVNFAKAFGAGVGKFATMTGKSAAEAAKIMNQYDEEMPFVKELGQYCDKVAQRRGYVRLIDGARCRFDLWELAWRPDGEPYQPPCHLDEARRRWPGRRIRRAYTHKAMNREIQGSAARQTKMAMRLCWRENLVPTLQMHDELNFCVTEEAQGRRVCELMEGAHKFLLPVTADVGYGPSWGEAVHDWADLPKAA